MYMHFVDDNAVCSSFITAKDKVVHNMHCLPQVKSLVKCYIKMNQIG